MSRQAKALNTQRDPAQVQMMTRSSTYATHSNPTETDSKRFAISQWLESAHNKPRSMPSVESVNLHQQTRRHPTTASSFERTFVKSLYIQSHFHASSHNPDRPSSNEIRHHTRPPGRCISHPTRSKASQTPLAQDKGDSLSL